MIGIGKLKMTALERWRNRIGGQELQVLLMLLIVVGGVWFFVQLADEVGEGETNALDERLLLALRNPADPTDPLGPSWFEEMMRDFTGLGGGGILAFVTLSVVGFLFIERRYALAILVLVAVLGGVLLSVPLKEMFGRPRPDLVPHSTRVYQTSFPSGHSMSAAATYLTLGALLARTQRRRRLKLYFLGLAISLTLIVGVSRVYLGVHWPTDVLAGWTAGTTWALFCWLVVWWLQQRRQLRHSS
jgi:undecaprenyl-diphosphatase